MAIYSHPRLSKFLQTYCNDVATSLLYYGNLQLENSIVVYTIMLFNNQAGLLLDILDWRQRAHSLP